MVPANERFARNGRLHLISRTDARACEVRRAINGMVVGPCLAAGERMDDKPIERVTALSG